MGKKKKKAVFYNMEKRRAGCSSPSSTVQKQRTMALYFSFRSRLQPRYHPHLGCAVMETKGPALMCYLVSSEGLFLAGRELTSQCFLTSAPRPPRFNLLSLKGYEQLVSRPVLMFNLITSFNALSPNTVTLQGAGD